MLSIDRLSNFFKMLPTGAYVTHMKNRTIFLYGAFECEPASEPLAHH